MWEWVQVIVSSILIICGLLITATCVFGLYRFKFVLNRMHAAAMNDTLGIMLVLLGLIVRNGMVFSSLKYILIILFLWLAGPVSSHLIGRMEVTIDAHTKNSSGEEGTDEYEILD